MSYANIRANLLYSKELPTNDIYKKILLTIFGMDEFEKYYYDYNNVAILKAMVKKHYHCFSYCYLMTIAFATMIANNTNNGIQPKK